MQIWQNNWFAYIYMLAFEKILEKIKNWVLTNIKSYVIICVLVS